MFISIVILIISFLLDGILTNFLPYGVGNLSLFTPLTTIVAIVLIYNFFYHNEKKYLIISFVTGIIYDLFYTDLLFLDGILFFIIAFMVIKLYKVIGFNYVRILLHVFVAIVVYEISFSLIIIIFNLVPMTIDRLLYKISHSLILNLIYAEIVMFIINRLPKKYKRIRLN